MFDRKYVRVESLALQRAFELLKEAGMSSCYIAESWLANEEGFAHSVANMGTEVRGPAGKVAYVALPPGALGLEGEVEGFTEAAEITDHGEIYLRRHYMLNFNYPKTNKHALHVYVILVKETEESDWKVEVEGAQKVTEHGSYGPSTEVIRREYRPERATA